MLLFKYHEIVPVVALHYCRLYLQSACSSEVLPPPPILDLMGLRRLPYEIAMPPANAVSDALCVTLCLFELVLKRVFFKHLARFRP